MTTKHIFLFTLSVLALWLPLVAACRPVHASSETVAYKFKGGPADGTDPQSGLSGDSAGNGYGTTYSGGAYGFGTFYKITPTGQETVLHSFAGGLTDGAYPSQGVTRGRDGNFYGATRQGGAFGYGTDYKITPTGQETILHSFAGGKDGVKPNGNLCQATDGNFYGTTYYGGSYSVGTFYKITSSGQETVLHTFTGGEEEGDFPNSVIQATDGYFYGTTSGGGDVDQGTVFKMTSTGQETHLHSFIPDPDGSSPESGLIQAKDGNLYGTTGVGGSFSAGTVYKITLTGQETVLYSFEGYSSNDGDYPSGLIQGKDGNFYGTTGQGGLMDYGTVFKITPSGLETVLYSFKSGSDGAYPSSPLVQDKTGYLYGTTSQGGGTANNGTIFRFIL